MTPPLHRCLVCDVLNAELIEGDLYRCKESDCGATFTDGLRRLVRDMTAGRS